ncbi:alpha/beta hydrolase family protein [Aureibacillus halotolerans]|uniref:Alpha/beta hydrolase family protein n=1 Tax=Aureibacillus halotolerans TaxID=1508390 RepID=A0A4R6U1V7_9BACI|nr:alpha/beta hydrolase family protein [Aureibacillus halotolerans]TDQ38663.1 alpha/beta hydrolase family protein [Aureibacillus halotolerans]
MQTYIQKHYQRALAQQEKAKAKRTPQEHADALQSEWTNAIGTCPDVAEAELHVNLIHSVERDGYREEKVELHIGDVATMPIYILIPHNVTLPAPAVLAIHGHGYGHNEIVGRTQTGEIDEEAPGIHQHFAVQLVKRGVIAVAPEVAGFGSRRHPKDIETDQRSSCARFATQLLMLGQTLTGYRTEELLQVLRYMQKRSDIQENAIGMMGFSGGGLLALSVGIRSTVPKAIVLCGFPSTFIGSTMDRPHCHDNYAPGLALPSELPGYISTLAPRPLFIESGDNDMVFPVEPVQECIAEVRKVYEAAGASEHMAHDIFPGVHEISGRRSYDWVTSKLHSST